VFGDEGRVFCCWGEDRTTQVWSRSYSCIWVDIDVCLLTTSVVIREPNCVNAEIAGARHVMINKRPSPKGNMSVYTHSSKELISMSCLRCCISHACLWIDDIS
jgi:hypothetical protein